MSNLRLFFLGPAQILDDGQPVELKAAKATALLGYLAVNGAPQTRDHLVGLLWPESLPNAARKSLRNTLWTIRKALGDEVLWQPEADRLALSDAAWVDVRVFEAATQAMSRPTAPDVGDLQAAVDLYRGPLLDGLDLLDAPDFEIWLTAERERFGQIYLRALKTLVATHRAAARWADVLSVAQQALAYDDLQEPMYRALMETYARLGERAQALHHYDRLKAALERELGVEPLPETEALRAAILSGDLGPVAGVVPVPVAQTRPTGRLSRSPALPLIGRQDECAALDEELQLAATGQARAVLLVGELGIGKSRLWQTWSAAQPPGAMLLETRCLDTTQSLPFAPLTGLFSRQACFEHLFTPPSPLSPIWLAELARLLPAIKTAWPNLPVPPMLPTEEERHRLFEAFTQALRALEGRPLILFIDDLQWADHATLDWLLYLVDRMRDEPLLLVGAYRPDDAPVQLVNLVARWGREGVARRLALNRLTLQEAADLIAAQGGDPGLAEQLHTRSAGNPYFLIELSRAAPDSTPQHLAELIQARLVRLPPAARQVLQAAAVLEADFDFDTLRRTSGRGEQETLDALDALLDAAVLDERRGRYEFVHPLVADVVLGDMSISRRSFLHRRAAEALETTYAGRLKTVAGALVRHYLQAGRPGQAARYAELAAERAMELTAPAEAAAFYRQALSWEPSPARRLGLGRALYMQGELESAREAMTNALTEFEAAGHRLGQAQACLALAESYLPSGQGAQVIEWAERALRTPGPELPPQILAQAHYLLGAGCMLAGRPLSQVEAHLVQAAGLAADNHLPGVSASSQFELGNLLAQRGDLASALQAFEQTIALAQAAGARFLEIVGHNNLAYHAHLMGDLTTAHEHIQAALSLADAHSIFLPRQYLYSTRGEIALAEGKLDEAENWFRRGLSEAEKYTNRLQAANIRANLGLVARARGELDEALVELEAARRAATAVTARHLQIQIDLWLAELYLQRGEQAAAREALARADERLAGGERRGLQTWAERIRVTLKSQVLSI